MSGHEECKLLIFIVAYNAETTIESVLSRIPVDALPVGTEVLVVDDSSADRTFETANRHLNKLASLPVTVLANPVNQGYGGNQKIGYQYAIENGFDVVALLHGDGQYAPEKLPELVAQVLAGEADACFGSRMMERGVALRGGMPLYKYVGNRILTAFQNAVLGAEFTEFHSGYRVYSVSALASLPFRYNSNDFHFDTEIIIQFIMSGRTIRELPIPTYYGDEICYVNGMAYAWHVVGATILSRVHSMGLLYQRKFDVCPGGDYGLKLGYPSSHTLAIAAVRDDSTVLDLACGSGGVARELTRKGCRVTGIDKQDAAPSDFERFVCHDLDGGALPPEVGFYDFILALDCLEHLSAPEKLLAELRERCYGGAATVILTAPNIGFFSVRLALLAGQFNYGKQGILDLTHRRLFTFRSLRRMLEEEGYEIVKVRGIPAPFPKALGNNVLGRALLKVNQALIFLCRGLFAYQIYVEARFLPPVSRLLARTIEASERRSARQAE